MDRAKYEVIMIGITRDGEWLRYYGPAEKINNDTWNNPADCIRAIISPCRGIHGLLELSSDTARRTRVDVAMPILHGRNGEDGTIQGLLELAGIPIAGSGTFSSALCMDKDLAHKVVALAGVKTAQSMVIDNSICLESAMTEIENLGYPLFVKPVRAGSSFGITKVSNKEELPAALALAFEHDTKVIIEENIQGVEIGCAVLGNNDDLTVGELDEIELDGGFFDYKEKYTLETAGIHVPARISAEKTAEIKEDCKTVYKALGCSGFARVDMFLTPDGIIYFNEVNTIPGFTVNSRYPKMLKEIGMSFEQIVDKIIELAVQ